MAPSDEENKSHKAQDDANPFIMFRRFADDQMSTLMNGIFSIPSLFGSSSTTPRRSVQDYEKWLLEARESSQRLARKAEEAGRVMEVQTRVQKEDQHVADPANVNESESLQCPYRPTKKGILSHERPSLDVCPMDDATRLSLAASSLRAPDNVLTAIVLGKPLFSVPVTYLLNSPYSPVWLEQQPRLCDYGAKWRDAFEDLLAVQSGQELLPKWSQRTHESSFDWVRGMIQWATCKQEDNTEDSGSIAEQYPDLLSCFTSMRQPENDANEDEDPNRNDLSKEEEEEDDDYDEILELDMYDRIFGSQQPPLNGVARAAVRSFGHLQPESSPPSTHDTNPSILSTLTTTERTTLQDGSVHTKVVLKKRFSDGREESTETVHHQNALRPVQDAASNTITDEDARKTGNDKGSKEEKSGGWFWS